MQKDKENIVIIILTILLVGLIAGNLCFMFLKKPSVQKEKIEKQEVEQVSGKDVSYETTVSDFSLSDSTTVSTDNSSGENSDTDDYDSDEGSDDGDSDDGDSDDDEYIFADSDSRKLKKSELEGMSKDELRLARNELYARHGYIFQDNGLQEYFESKSWYEPSIKSSDFNDAKIFNKYEIANRNLIKKVENSK